MADWSDIRTRCQMLTPPMPWDKPRWRPRDRAPVVLLHGLWRGWRAMEPLERTLAAEGWSTLNIPYPSIRLPIEVITRRVRSAIAEIANDQPVHFVTHSLGGIIVRALLADASPWKPGRIVMLAPPHGGSEIVDWAKRMPLLSIPLGPSGRQLGAAELASSVPALPAGIEAAVIMGNRSTFPFFRTLLEKENDGIVSVSRGKIPGLKGFSIVNADHTFIQVHPDTLRQTSAFLRDGALTTK